MATPKRKGYVYKPVPNPSKLLVGLSNIDPSQRGYVVMWYGPTGPIGSSQAVVYGIFSSQRKAYKHADTLDRTQVEFFVCFRNPLSILQPWWYLQGPQYPGPV